MKLIKIFKNYKITILPTGLTPEACSAERALAIVRMCLLLNGSASYSLAAAL
jgi:hypothetical protein